MSKFLQVHPVNPQARAISRAVEIVRGGGVIVYPTDSGFALGCRLGDKNAQQRIAAIRQVDTKHNFTLMCSDFAQAGTLAILDNSAFRLLKRLTPGPYTFILEGTKEVPRASLNPKKKTIGIRISPHPVVLALVSELGAPMVSSTLLPTEADEEFTDGWQVFEKYENQVDLVLDCDIENPQPTTVIDLSEGEAQVIRQGAGKVDSL